MDVLDNRGFQKEVDTVRALHQTVVSLRAALEQSRIEIEELKERIWSSESCELALQTLSLENHILRRKIIVQDAKSEVEKSPKFKLEPNLKNADEVIKSPQKVNFKPNLEELKTQSENEDLSKQKVKQLISEPIKSPRKEQEKSPYKQTDKLSKNIQKQLKGEKIPVQHLETINVNKSPSKKISGKLSDVTSPRKTIVTVNVTVKSPRKTPTKCEKLIDSSTDKVMENQHNQPEDLGKETEKIAGEEKEFDGDGEVDDIELIFTTDETTTTVIKEELVSIADGNDGEFDTPVLLNYRTVDFDATDINLSCENMDKDLDDDVFHENETNENFENENKTQEQPIHNSKSDNSINRDSNTENESQRDKSLKSCYSYQDSSFECRSLDKDESFDKFDDKDKYLHKMWSNNSVLVETDISKCGIVEPESLITHVRRNTCPNPTPYRPIMHREALAKHTRTLAVKFCTPRPILNENYSPKTESEAQTDISALPSLWKSESYLAHKVSHQFTTLPSKFPMPISQKSLRLSEKTKEARRVLLSDINFTSMVPELSRSADHLYQEENQKWIQTCGYGQYLNAPGPQLHRYNTGDSLTSPSFVHSQKFTWSPSDYSNFSSTKFDNSNIYLNKYRGSLTSVNTQNNSFDLGDNVKRRSYSTSHWRQNTPASFDNSRYVRSGQGPYRSVPNSPTKSRSIPLITNYGSHVMNYPSGTRVVVEQFGKQDYTSGIRYLNGSLPELHGDHDSGDSTDSLVEEAEQYLRSSIDCIVSGRDMTHSIHATKRRSSAPCPGRDSSPPRNWQPFLPHGIKDLRSDNWVKVIGPENKIRGGRVRYVGYVLGQKEPFVGLELATSTGNSDGTFNNRRYFDCSPNHALFIPFKKVVMGWRN